MTNDQIIRLAQESGLPTTVGWLDSIMRFAAAVVAVEREALERENDGLRQVCRDIYEVWAGSDALFAPETATEAYLLRLVQQMRDAAREGLK